MTPFCIHLNAEIHVDVNGEGTNLTNASKFYGILPIYTIYRLADLINEWRWRGNMVILHNIAAMNARNILNVNNSKKAKSMEKLSSGYRINRSADDAAGLAISEKMRRQIRGLSRASENAQDGISLVQVADGGLEQSHELLQRMNELAIKASNGTNSPSECQAIQEEMNQLIMELTRIADTTTFNETIKPLHGGKVETAAAATRGYELPPSVSDRTVNFTYIGDASVSCDGITYYPGESFSVDNVLTIMQGNDFSDFGFSAICHGTESQFAIATGMGSLCLLRQDSVFKIDDVIVNTPQVIKYQTLDDLEIDENGYLYTVPDYLPSSERHYLGESRYLRITDPTVENLEAAGIQKVIYTDKKAEESGSSTRETFLDLQVGMEAGHQMSVALVDATAKGLGVDPLDVSTPQNAVNVIPKISSAIETVSRYRGHFGAIQNRLEHTIANLDNTVENTQAAESKIRDTDMAKETVALSNVSVLSQVAQSVLAQANQQPQGVLSLLK